MDAARRAELSEGDWTRALGEHFEGPVRVSYGVSRSRVVQARWKGSTLELRLHRFFRHAGDETIADMVSWLQSGRRARAACARLDTWIDAQVRTLPPRQKRTVRARPAGEVHDLDALAHELWSTYFDPAAAGPGIDPEARPTLTFGRRGRRKVRHTLQLGAFERERNVVRVNPVLDQAAVPAWFVRYILYHELLHAALPDERTPSGRRVHHSPRFRRLERSYVDYDRAIAWQEQWIGRLIRSARSGEPLRPARKEPSCVAPKLGARREPERERSGSGLLDRARAVAQLWLFRA